MERLAIYAGTFDPITRGHLSVIARAARMFDEVIVLIAVNPEKQPLLTVDERLALIRQSVESANVKADATEQVVVEYARSHGAGFLVRGIRSSTDLDGEIALANLNFQLAPEIATIFIPAEPELAEVSSSHLKELLREGRDISAFCPPLVARRLAERLGVCPQLGEETHV
jgi:pantetheine-phosphate adenylyltransferase